MSAVQIPEKFTVCVCYFTLALTELALNIPVSTMLQDVMQLSKLLLASYQFSSVRIPIE